MLILHDRRIPHEYQDAIKRLFPGVSFCPFEGAPDNAPRVYDSISCHPDIYFFQMNARTMVHAPSVPEEVLFRLRVTGIELIKGEKDPSGGYPLTALYNVARAGRAVFCNLGTVDEKIAETIKARGLEVVDVAQGYSACSVIPVGEKALITADLGIARAAGAFGLEILAVSRGHVSLPGEKYGFLGGACGVMPDESVLFLGDITRHPDHAAIRSFFERHGVKSISLARLPLLDAGRLIIIENRG